MPSRQPETNVAVSEPFPNRQAAEIRMADAIRDYYGDGVPPLPRGVVAFDPSEIEDGGRASMTVPSAVSR